jgi:hypothetical protein
MASRMAARASASVALPETSSPLSGSSSANSWEVVASDDDGVDVEAVPSSDGDASSRDTDTRERDAEVTPAGSPGSSAGSAGASAAMRKLHDAMVAGGTCAKENANANEEEGWRQKKKKKKSAKARLERLRVRASARRYRDLGLCERECAALAIATELVVSESSNFSFTPNFALRELDSLEGAFGSRTEVFASSEKDKSSRRRKKKSASSVDDDDDDDDDNDDDDDDHDLLAEAFAARPKHRLRFLLRGATRFETFLVFARLGAKLRDLGGSSFRASSIFAAPRAAKIDGDRRPASETLVLNGTRRKPFYEENKNSEGLGFGVLAVAVVAAALAAAARALGRRGAWRAAAAAAAAAARSAATAARVTRE